MQAATQRIADILTTSGQAASANSGAGAGAARTARDGTSSFQQQPAAAAQDALPTVAVPTTFTHDTWNAENYGRKLQQAQVLLRVICVITCKLSCFKVEEELYAMGPGLGSI